MHTIRTASHTAHYTYSFPGLVIESKNELNKGRASESTSINTQCDESLLIKLSLGLTKQNAIWSPLDVPATACHLELS